VYDSREAVGLQNVHPFLFDGASFALAQNGDLHDFARMRYDLLDDIHPSLVPLIEGTTDTEWVYALMLSQLDDPFGPIGPDDAARAVVRTLEIIRQRRERHQIATQSPVNLVLTDGSWMIATRYAYDYGWYPDDASFFAAEREHDFTTLWYTVGNDNSEGDTTCLGTAGALVASEPLSKHTSGWLEAPEYSMLVLTVRDRGGVAVDMVDLA
jgi:predicted glutamine amidotransferase